MNTKIIAKVVVLISLGLFLGSRLLNGTLSYYIHPRFNNLTALTAVGFILVGIVYARQNLSATSQEDSHHHDHDDHDSHHHSHDLSWWGVAILLLPALLGVLVQPKPLGANALVNRNINIDSLTSAKSPESNQLDAIATSSERNILDWLYQFQRSGDLSQLNGENVHVIGFVYRDERFDSEQFMVSRFIVSCCVADAAPAGLIVQWPETAELKADEWVEVEGTLQMGKFNDLEIPLLIADSVTLIDAPNHPYLYQ